MSNLTGPTDTFWTWYWNVRKSYPTDIATLMRVQDNWDDMKRQHNYFGDEVFN